MIKNQTRLQQKWGTWEGRLVSALWETSNRRSTLSSPILHTQTHTSILAMQYCASFLVPWRQRFQNIMRQIEFCFVQIVIVFEIKKQIGSLFFGLPSSVSIDANNDIGTKQKEKTEKRKVISLLIKHREEKEKSSTMAKRIVREIEPSHDIEMHQHRWLHIHTYTSNVRNELGLDLLIRWFDCLNVSWDVRSQWWCYSFVVDFFK